MGTETRPSIWVGHITLTVRDPRRSHDFYTALGMRPVFAGDEIAITELRGGTHLLLFPGEPTRGAAPFDLMVEDLHATHTRYIDAGLDVTAIFDAPQHQVFTLSDPDGHQITVYNDHTQGPT